MKANETTAETTASGVKQTLHNAANKHPRKKYALRLYSAEVRDGHRPGVVVVNLLCYYEREIAALGEPPAITNGRGRPPGGPEMWQNRSDQFCHNSCCWSF